MSQIFLIVRKVFFFGRLLPFLQIRKQMKTLRNGSFPEVRIKKKWRPHSGYCHLGVFLCLCVMVYYTMSMTTYTSAEEAMAQQGHVPFVTLEEIEGLPPVYPIDYSDPAAFPEEDDYLYSEDRSLLAPKQFILRQDEAEPPCPMGNALPLFWAKNLPGLFLQNNKKDTASGLF